MQDTANPYPNVPLPVGAVRAHGWGSAPSNRTSGRHPLLGRLGSHDPHRPAHPRDIAVTIDGVQHSDGRVERYIVVGQSPPDGTTFIDHPITPPQARLGRGAHRSRR